MRCFRAASHPLNLLRRSAGAALRRLLDISVAEWAVIGELGARAPVSLNELAAGLALDKTRLSRTVTGLVGRGLVPERPIPPTGGNNAFRSRPPAGAFTSL